MGKIDIRDIAKNGKKTLEIAVDFLYFQTVIGEVGGGYGIFKIKKTQIDDIALVEKVLNFHKANSPI
jgi:hypothetical protein